MWDNIIPSKENETYKSIKYSATIARLYLSGRQG
jgi:hypothetical protein